MRSPAKFQRFVVAFVVALSFCATPLTARGQDFEEEEESKPKVYKRQGTAEEAEEELFLPDEYLSRDWTTPPEIGRRFAVGEGDSIEDGYQDDTEQEELELNRIQEGERPDPFDVFLEAPLETEEDDPARMEDDEALGETYDDPAEW